MNELRQLNECGTGKSWAKDCTIYESKLCAPVVTFIHPDTHQFTAAAPARIVKPFQEHAQP